jgi:hypothetical protein
MGKPSDLKFPPIEPKYVADALTDRVSLRPSTRLQRVG